jgi:hypothetical protein
MGPETQVPAMNGIPRFRPLPDARFASISGGQSIGSHFRVRTISDAVFQFIGRSVDRQTFSVDIHS